MAAAAQHLDAAPGDPLSHHANRLGRRDDVLVTGDQEGRAVDPRRVGRLHLGEGLARARVALGVLTHQELAHEGGSRGPPNSSIRRHARLKQRVRDRLQVTLARLRGAGADRRPRRLGRREQGPEQREARHLAGLGGGQMRRNDGAHRVGDDVRALDLRLTHDQQGALDE